jgi:hypothetical protein
MAVVCFQALANTVSVITSRPQHVEWVKQHRDVFLTHVTSHSKSSSLFFLYAVVQRSVLFIVMDSPSPRPDHPLHSAVE